METDNFITVNSPSKSLKTRVVENRIRDIFIQCLVFNKTIIPLTLVGYELMIADSVLRISSVIYKSSYLTRVRGIIVEYTIQGTYHLLI